MNLPALPVLEVLPQLRTALISNPIVLLEAPTGAGKSTGLPLALLQNPDVDGRKIIMLQPRRLAAKSVACRLAAQLGQMVGETVGYRVRFDSQISAKTRIEVVTEGILTRQLQQDNELSNVGLIIFDEFHERSLQSDLALALCRDVQSILRPDLRLLLMSATLEAKWLAEKLDAPVIRSSGRQYPVEIIYHEPDTTLPIPRQVSSAILRLVKEEAGDILAFLPGTGEIKKTTELLLAQNCPAIIHQLYGDLPPAQQDQALVPDSAGRQKIILATSIAETSLTIEGITAIVDCGWSRRPVFNPSNGLTSLATVKVSLATAAQRAGRAGRLGPGRAVRLWAKGAEAKLPTSYPPEILEADLSNFCLELAEWGATEAENLSWVDAPPAGHVAAARSLLYSLSAIKPDGKITDEGRQLNSLPTHPRIAHLLLIGKQNGSADLAIDVAALLEERDPMPWEISADLSLRIEALRRERKQGSGKMFGKIEQVCKQWSQVLKTRVGIKAPPDTAIGLLIAAAYPERVAKAEKAGASFRYRLAGGQWAKLPDGDPLFHAEWIAIGAYNAQDREGRVFSAAPLDAAWLNRHATANSTVSWDDKVGVVKAVEEYRFGVLVVSERKIDRLTDEQAIPVLLSAVKKEGLKIFNPNDEALQWLARMASLRIWMPELELPDFSEESLLVELEDWLTPFLIGIRKKSELQKCNLITMLKSRIRYDIQQKIGQLAPTHITVPTGSDIVVQYNREGSPPVLAVRLQEMFGLADTPEVANGKVKVMLHLLSPGYKPVQVTQDLRSFWNTTYAQVRKEIRGRYPKHHWPDDPWTAEAVRGVKRRNHT